MNPLLKTSVIVVGACISAGLIAYAGLSKLIQAQEVAVRATAASEQVVAPVEVLLEPELHVGWVFRLVGAARDDPESGRMLTATAEFLGAVDSCDADTSPRGGQSLGVDGAGEAAQAAREVRVCVPGCVGQVPPPARSAKLPRRLELSAFQEEFDRAPDDYAPQGVSSSVDWQCGTRAGRVTAAAVIALACNAEACADEQLANASVFLGTESGRQLAPAKAFFALRSTSKAPLVGSVALP